MTELYDNHFNLLDVDECLTSPCKNGATCVNNDGGYQCQCGAGWTGDQCDKGTLSFKQTLWHNMRYVHADTFAMLGVGKKKGNMSSSLFRGTLYKIILSLLLRLQMSMSAIQVRVRTGAVAKTPMEPTLASVMLDMVGSTVNKVWPGIPL